jgi:uncharacterized protein (DUF2141 family)
VKSTLRLTSAVLACALGLVAAPATAAECLGQPSATKLVVHVAGLRSAKGLMAVTLYPDESKRFLAPKGKLLRERPPAKSPVTTSCFFLPKPGFYAIAVYHDENADKDFNRTIVGMPAEGFGFSNNPSTKTGLPSFKSVRFEAGPGETQTRITLRYLR